MRKWSYSKIPMNAGVSLERTRQHFNDMMKSYPHTWRGYRASFTYPSEERIKHIRQPVLLMSVDGSLKEEIKTASSVFPHAEDVHLYDFTSGVLDLGPEVIAVESRKFPDR